MNAFIKYCKKFASFISSSKFMLAVSLILNIVLWVLLTVFVSRWLYVFVVTIAFFIAIIIIARSKDPIVYKFSWLITMVLFPLFGICFYFYFKSSRISNKKQILWTQIQEENQQYLKANNQALMKLKIMNNNQARLGYFLQNTTKMPIYTHADAEYFKSGEELFDALLEDLEKAEKFIYLEFFIIKQGELWYKILKILREKAKTGVEVKVLYDDYGCLDVFSKKRKAELEKLGIKICAFNKLKFFITRFSNYRDHRKIAIIDGKIAYTGGINLADEYANLIERFGYWKDTGVKVQYEAVYAFTVLFATNWRIASGEQIDIKALYESVEKNEKADDILQVFGSDAIGSVKTAKLNYDNMINLARNHIYIVSPYFILDEETRNALKMASMSGVTIKILLPGVPDKRVIYNIGRTFYRELLEESIEIYELNGAFTHAKMVEIDGTTAAIGTTNFDFRSLYLHFEDTVMLYKSQAVTDIKNDFEDLFKHSTKIELDKMEKDGFFKRIYIGFVKLFLPLL